jgi:hypothetical protein
MDVSGCQILILTADAHSVAVDGSRQKGAISRYGVGNIPRRARDGSIKTAAFPRQLKQRNRTRTFCQQTAARLVAWARADSVLVFERLTLPQPSKKLRVRKGTQHPPSLYCASAQWAAVNRP